MKTIEEIKAAFFSKVAITEEQMMSNRKPLNVAHKQVLYYLLHQEGYSMMKIAQGLNTSKSSIQFSIQKAKEYLSINDPMIKNILSTILK